MTDIVTAGGVDRRAFVADLIAAAPHALVVTGLGSSTWDVFAAGDRDENFYLWGAMGGAACVGLGIALAQPQRPVVVVTGDGEQLMGLGALATIGVQQPPNLTIVVLDNGHYVETGRQPSHTGLGVDLVGVARSSGIAKSTRITRQDEVTELADLVNARSDTVFCAVAIAADEPSRALPPRDGVHLKNRFRATLDLPTF